MELVAVPFVPTHAEYIFLSGRTILADQMEFLLAHFPRNSPLHQRIRSPLWWLQRLQDVTTFCHISRPPRLNGAT